MRSLDLYARHAPLHRDPDHAARRAPSREVEVRHHPRVAGESKYGISRVLKVIADLFAIQMLTRFREYPLRWFGMLGLPFLLASLLATGATAAHWPGTVVMPAVALLTSLTFLSCLLYGLLGEVIIESAGRGRSRRVVYRAWETER